MSSQSQGSRLAQIQMRYQQKQLQENAQKKSEMFDDTQKLLSSSLGAGKVRAMFDERRQSQRKTAGIDKSYLLEPIVVDTNKTTVKRGTTLGGLPKPNGTRTTIDQRVNYSKVIVPPLQNRLINHDINGNTNFSSSTDPLDRTFRDSSRIIANNGSKANQYHNEKINVANATAAAAPVMRKPATVNTQANSVKSSASYDGSPLTTLTNQNRKIAASPAKSVSSNSSSSAKSLASGKSSTSGQSRTQSTVINTNVAKKSPMMPKSPPQQSFDDDNEDDEENDNAPVPDGLIRCSICKRNFAEDRIEKHQVICQKTKTKKRKVFDASKKRVEGTEAAVFVAKKPTSGARAKAQPKPAPAAAASGKSSWRTKHEEFIAAVRAAREVQAHLAKGGKLSDLPPPPPSENPDYVQCPHCSRRFNESAAARHIPQCKNMQHNKPKAKASVGAGGKGVTSQMKRR